MNSQETLSINEYFISIQSEGPTIGRQCAFIKFYDGSESIEFTALWQWLRLNDVKFLVVSGKEPLEHNQLIPFLNQAIMTSKTFLSRVEIESSGTIFPDSLDDLIRYTQPRNWLYFNVSPKLSKEYNPDVLNRFNVSNRAIFKFLVSDNNDYVEILEILKEVKIPTDKVWIMADGNNLKKQQKGLVNIAENAIKLGFNISPRLHIK